MLYENTITARSRLLVLSLLLASPLYADEVPANEPAGPEAIETMPADAQQAVPPEVLEPLPPELEEEGILSFPAKSKIKSKKSKRKAKPERKSSPAKAPAAATSAKPSSSVKSTPTVIAPSQDDKRHHVGAKALFSYFGSGLGLEYIYQPWSLFDIGLSFAGTQASFERESATKTTEILKGAMSNVRTFARLSYYRLVYVGVGVSISSISGTYGFEGTGVAGGSIEGDYEAQYLSPEIFIGSEWNFSNNFYIGVDWAGFGVPTELSLDVSSDENLDLTSELLTGFDAETRISEEVTAQLKLFYLMFRGGYRF